MYMMFISVKEKDLKVVSLGHGTFAAYRDNGLLAWRSDFPNPGKADIEFALGAETMGAINAACTWMIQ